MRIERKDTYALLLLTVLWVLFFWRALTPASADQVSLAEGDFSGQFYAFSAYQARRLLSGEVPLWNPFNNAGHPFLADTQSAVFYPPRLLAIYLSDISGGWHYGALQLEAIAHYWLGSVLMYIFVRCVTRQSTAGLVAAITWTYSGYLTGYPILQLAILESAIWTPLVLLGIHQATRRPEPVRWPYVGLSGTALGISLMAGHPQTALFIIYLSLAYLAYQLSTAPDNFQDKVKRFVLAAAILGIVGAGLAAVQLVPGWEYLQHTTRADMGFDAKAGGFPIQDVAQFLIPDLLTFWSPQYIGLAGLILAILAIWRKLSGAWFWGGAALVGLLLSFGGRTVVYDLAYNLLPGLRLFRGQERAAFVVTFSLAMLTGLGTAGLTAQTLNRRFARRFMGVIAGGAVFIFGLAAILFVARIDPNLYGNTPQLDAATLATILAALTSALFAWRLFAEESKLKYWTVALMALIVFDLFSVNMGRGFEPVPLEERPHLSTLVTHETLYTQPQPFRVDGREGLEDNYGTLLGLADIDGISPLRLTSHQDLMRLPEALRWRLLGVQYVFSAREDLPVESEIIASEDNIHLHELTALHPLAWLDEINPGDWPEPFTPIEESRVTFKLYEPEHIAVEVETPEKGFVFFSEYVYPGWHAKLDGAPVDILTAWGYLRAVAVPAGTHIIEMNYRPVSFTLGAMISLGMLLMIGGGGLGWFIQKRNREKL